MLRVFHALWGAWMQTMSKDSGTLGRSKELTLTIYKEKKKEVENSLTRQEHQK